MYIGTLCTYLCAHHVVMNNTSLPYIYLSCTTLTQLIQRKTTKTSPRSLIHPSSRRYCTRGLQVPKICIPYSKVSTCSASRRARNNTSRKTREKNNMFMCSEFFFSHQRLHVVVVSCKVALHGKTEDFFLVYGPCSKYKVLPLRTCRYM